MFRKLFKNEDTTAKTQPHLGVRDRHALKKYGNVASSSKYGIFYMSLFLVNCIIGNIQFVGHRARKQQLADLMQKNSSFFFSDTKQPKKISFMQRIKMMFGVRPKKPAATHKKGVKHYY